MQHPYVLYQGKALLAFRGRRKKGKTHKMIHGEKHANSNRAEIKATYLPSNWGGIERRKFQQILIVFSCGPDGGTLRTAVSRDDGVCKLNKKLFPRHMILDIQTQPPPPTVCSKWILLEFCMRKKRDPFRQELFHCDAPLHTRGDL